MNKHKQKDIQKCIFKRQNYSVFICVDRILLYNNSLIASFVLANTFLYFKTEPNFKPSGKIIARY